MRKSVINYSYLWATEDYSYGLDLDDVDESELEQIMAESEFPTE